MGLVPSRLVSSPASPSVVRRRPWGIANLGVGVNQALVHVLMPLVLMHCPRIANAPSLRKFSSDGGCGRLEGC